MWEVKEFPHELLVKNGDEMYHIYRKPDFKQMPDGKTLYTAFEKYFNDNWWDESVKKSYYAPVRCTYTIKNGNVRAGDYIITPDGEITATKKTALDPIEDIVRFPCSKIPPDVRKELARYNFYTVTAIKYGMNTEEIMTDGTNIIHLASRDPDTFAIYDAWQVQPSPQQRNT